MPLGHKAAPAAGPGSSWAQPPHGLPRRPGAAAQPNLKPEGLGVAGSGWRHGRNATLAGLHDRLCTPGAGPGTEHRHVAATFQRRSPLKVPARPQSRWGVCQCPLSPIAVAGHPGEARGKGPHGAIACANSTSGLYYPAKKQGHESRHGM